MKVPSVVQKAYVAARKARGLAYAPYSKFKVGAAAVVGDDVVTGCNVENASYGGTVCAERVAIWKCVGAGQKSFKHVVVVTDGAAPAYPCGLCLQVMAEFFEPETQIWIGDLKGIRAHHSFSELLLKPFGPRQLAIGLKKSGTGKRG